MIYGMILDRHIKWKESEQRAGRYRGNPNQKHVWDGYESQILSMYASGLTMYRISKELKINAATVRRFFVVAK